MEFEFSEDIFEEGKNGCEACDGYGVMRLFDGFDVTDAPCLDCSFNKSLEEIYDYRNLWLKEAIRAVERKRIREHNDRIERDEG